MEFPHTSDVKFATAFQSSKSTISNFTPATEKTLKDFYPGKPDSSMPHPFLSCTDNSRLSPKVTPLKAVTMIICL